jgi:hypothetical protein
VSFKWVATEIFQVTSELQLEKKWRYPFEFHWFESEQKLSYFFDPPRTLSSK